METTYQNESNVIVNSQEYICTAITTKNTRCKMKAKWRGNEGAWHGVCLCQRHYNMGLENIITIYHADASQILKKKKKPTLKTNKLHSRKVNSSYEYTKDDVNHIIKIQSHIRRKIVNISIRDRGIAVFCRHLITNNTDFAEFSDIKNSKEISNNDFISYIDDKKRHWGFHIASFKELLKITNTNPYSTNKIPEDVISKFKKLLEKIEKTKSIEIHKEKITDPKIIIQQKCIKVFQIIDSLGQYTQCKWFLDLNIAQLKELYKQVEDIWNYRAELKNEDKLKYVKDGKLFVKKINEINAIKSKNQLIHLLLDDFYKLVTEGETKSDCQTGALWILSALTIVSFDARASMSWLFQSANVY